MIAQVDPLYLKMRPMKAVSRLVTHLMFEGRPLTTRARWMNCLNLAMFRLAEYLPIAVPVKSPMFILGTGRSGSTILGKVLSMHRDVGWLNEPKLLWHVVYPEEDIIGSYSRGAAYYRLGAEQATEQVYQRIHHLYGFYLAVTDSARVLDKYPEMIFRVPFLRAIFPDVKFIFLVRNGWDTVRSIELWSKQYEVVTNGEVYDWWGCNNRKWRLLVDQVVASSPDFAGVHDQVTSFSCHADMAAVEWITTMHEGLQLMEKVPEQVHLVRYEEFTTCPREILKKLTEFCELSTDETFLTYACKVLKPVPTKEPIDLHPAIQPLFVETMKALDYTL